MKKVFTLTVIIAVAITVFAQSPQKMSYQAVIRNTTGGLITNHAVGMRISILQGSATGTVVFSETYNPNPQTNANGLVSLEIGTGLPITGTFSAINWAAGPYYLKIETDPAGGTSYTIVGTSQLLSVPYALYAKTASTANYNDLSNKPTILNSQWTSSGSNIYYNLGRVGIGTNSPTKALTVLTAGVDGILVKSTSTFATIDIDAYDGDAALRFYKAGTPMWNVRNQPSTDDFEFHENGVGTRMVIKNGTGNIGIGTSTPGSKLDVEGTVSIGGGNTSELNRDQTTTANLVPICYGCVSAAGTIHAAGSTTNFTIIKTGTGVYEINISGVVVDYYNFTVSATLIGPGPAFIVTGSANAHVTVNTYNTSGAATDRAFYFVVYKP
jgi:hypothetical protein